MKAILAIMKVIFYVLLMYVILPVLFTLIMIVIKSFNSVIKLMESGQDTPELLQLVGENIFVELTSTSTVMFITIFSGIIGLFFVWIIFKIRHKKFREELKICKMRDNDKWFPLDKIRMLILVGIATNFVAMLITTYIPYPQEWILNYTEKIDSTLMGNMWVNMLFAVFYAGIFEELFFRGLIYTRLRNGMNKTIAACLSAVLFGLVHVSPVQIIYATVIGLILAYVFEKFESIIPCIVIHMANNFVGVIMSTIPVDIAENYICVGSYVVVMSVITVIATRWLVKQKKEPKTELSEG